MEKEPMQAKLGGIVELDETYVGGKVRPGQPRLSNKSIVFTLVQRDGEARSKVVPNVQAQTLKGIIRRNVEGEAHIMTDEMASYTGLDKEFASHETVVHSREEYVRGIVHVNFAESYFSLLKRGIIGTFHHISAKHMQRYLEELDFRWNRRDVKDAERMQSAIAGAEGVRLYYKVPAFLRGA
jgi:transposase-like protein